MFEIKSNESGTRTLEKIKEEKDPKIPQQIINYKLMLFPFGKVINYSLGILGPVVHILSFSLTFSQLGA